MAYKRLLVAIDLGTASDKIAVKAASMARTQHAEIHILHIVEPLSLTYGAKKLEPWGVPRRFFR